MPFKLTLTQIQAAIAAHDLRTYEGWNAACAALLADGSNWTGIKQNGGLIVKIDGHICGCADDGRSDAVYSEDDLFDFDSSAGVGEAWDGVNPTSNCAELESPSFMTLRHE